MANKIDAKDTVVQTQLMLEKIKVGYSRAVGRNVLEDMELKAYDRTPLIDGMVYELTTRILSQSLCKDEYTISDKQYVKYPDGAWQYFKLDHMPKWFKRKFPVKWFEQPIYFKKTIKIDRRETYPMASLVIENNRQFITLMGAPVIRDIVEEI